MAKIHLLKPRQVGTLPVGLHSDGSNLYLRVSSPTARAWIFRYTARGRTRQLGLGSTVERSIVDARVIAQKMREAIRDGLDPANVLKARDPRRKTFRAYAEEFMAKKRKNFRSEKWGKQWSATMTAFVYPLIGDKPASEITIADVESVLQPIWARITETASRVRSRIAAVLDYAYLDEGIERRNPAAFRENLEHRGFGSPRKIQPIEHRPSAPYSSVPAIMAELRERDSTSALCLRFTILTWVRSIEARGADWQEFSSDYRIWTIPGRRMKGGREHQVPICEEAREILAEMAKRRRTDTTSVFPGGHGGLISDVAINKALHSLPTVQRLDEEATARLRSNLPPDERDDAFATGVTVHGFRSSARSWGAANHKFEAHVQEHALAHVNTNRVEAAYQRDTVLEKRRLLMEAWGRFCREGNVLPFRKRGAV